MQLGPITHWAWKPLLLHSDYKVVALCAYTAHILLLMADNASLCPRYRKHMQQGLCCMSSKQSVHL